MLRLPGCLSGPRSWRWDVLPLLPPPTSRRSRRGGTGTGDSISWIGMARRRTQSPFLHCMRPLTNGDRHTDAGHVGVGSGVIPCHVSGGRGPPARGVGAREVRMPLEKPCSPGHCLGMFNDYMRTDMLRHVHQSLQARMDQRGTRSHRWPSSLRVLRKSWGSLKAVSSLRVLGRIPSIVIHAIAGPRLGFARRRRVTMISRYCNRSLQGCASSAQALTAGDGP